MRRPGLMIFSSVREITATGVLAVALGGCSQQSASDRAELGTSASTESSRPESGNAVRASAQSQISRGELEVGLKSVVSRGDTVAIVFIVHNGPPSKTPLATFLVDAPSGVVRIETPSPQQSWMVSTDFGGRPVAYWAMLDLLPLGSATPPLHYESVGLPGIVNYWAGGDVPPKGGEEDEPNPRAPPTDPLATEMSIRGKTVGVEAWPANRTPQALLARLRLLMQTSCVAPLLWLSDSALCSQLITDLDRARKYQSSGQTSEAKAALDHFVSLVSGPNGTATRGVSSAGYWLAVSNAEIIGKRL